MEVLATLATGFAGGVLSWSFTSFVAEPIQHLRTIKRVAISCLADVGNVGPVAGQTGEDAKARSEQIMEARVRIRRAAIDLKTFAGTNPKLTRVYGVFGYDIYEAGASLMGFSNSIFGHGTDRHNFREAFAKALKVPAYD